MSTEFDGLRGEFRENRRADAPIVPFLGASGDECSGKSALMEILARARSGFALVAGGRKRVADVVAAHSLPQLNALEINDG